MASTKGKTDESRGEKGRLDLLPTSLPDGAGVLVKDKPKKGRPTLFSDVVAAEICQRVIAGSNLNKICNSDDMPSRDTLYRWLAEYTDFSDNYARACKIRREFKYEILDEIPDSEPDVQRARLKVDVIKWQLGKEDSKKYGDKMDVTTDGKALPAPLFGGLSVSSDKDQV